MATPEGWHGWDEYAAFYDWENARTFGRRDIAFWRDFVAVGLAPVLELGCGTGRLLAPLARTGVPTVGIDRSALMLQRARKRASRLRRSTRPTITRGDIRTLPFRTGAFGAVIAAYGLIQSMLSDDDLDAVLSEIVRVLRPGGQVGFDLVPDLPRWDEYRRQVRLRGQSDRGSRVTLVETVRQDRTRGWTTFDEEFVERRGRRTTRRRFSLTFRTVTVRDIVARLERAQLIVEAVFGDYGGSAWAPESDTWLIVARKA